MGKLIIFPKKFLDNTGCNSEANKFNAWLRSLDGIDTCADNGFVKSANLILLSNDKGGLKNGQA